MTKMKTFDCQTCKNKQNGFMHCLFYLNEPDIEICTGFQKIANNTILAKHIEKIIKRKAIELLNNFQDIGFTYNDWSNKILEALHENQIDMKNIQIVSRFVRSFCENGCSFACDNCGDIVELKDDSNAVCSGCKKSKFSFI